MQRRLKLLKVRKLFNFKGENVNKQKFRKGENEKTKNICFYKDSDYNLSSNNAVIVQRLYGDIEKENSQKYVNEKVESVCKEEYIQDFRPPIKIEMLYDTKKIFSEVKLFLILFFF